MHLKQLRREQVAGQEQTQADFLLCWRATFTTIAAFEGFGEDAYFWSSKEYDAQSAGSLNLYYDDNIIYLGENDYKEYGYNIRCLKDY